MGKFEAGAASGISFTLACFAFLAGGPWSRLAQSGGAYVAAAVLGGLVAFIAATIMHGRRDGPGGASRLAGSMAFGWAAGIAGIILAWMSVYVLIAVLFALGGFPVGRG